MASQQSMPLKAPYPPTTASVGGRPTVSVDVPTTSVFLFLYILAAAGHMTILQINLRRGHKFLMSGLLFGFCMARVVTCIMRIVWACYPTNVRVAIAATIFVSAGVLLLFLINLLFAQRIVRAAHPHFGWHRALHWVFIVLYALIVMMLVVVITATVQSFYTLNPNTHRIDRDLQLTAATYFMFVAFLPFPLVIVGLIVPRKTRVEKFGSGRWRTKIWVLLTASTFLLLGTAFRTGTAFKNPRPIQHPAWYHAKWCFYFFDFTTEIIVVYLYLLLRVDRRFYIPNGSKGPGDYVREAGAEEEKKKPESARNMRLISSEEDVFDDKEPENERGSKDVEKNARPGSS